MKNYKKSLHFCRLLKKVGKMLNRIPVHLEKKIYNIKKYTYRFLCRKLADLRIDLNLFIISEALSFTLLFAIWLLF